MDQKDQTPREPLEEIKDSITFNFFNEKMNL